MFRKRAVVYAFQHEAREPVTIHTLEGDMTAMPGDWIVSGVEGETYPCKDRIFRATYEPVE